MQLHCFNTSIVNYKEFLINQSIDNYKLFLRTQNLKKDNSISAWYTVTNIIFNTVTNCHNKIFRNHYYFKTRVERKNNYKIQIIKTLIFFFWCQYFCKSTVPPTGKRIMTENRKWIYTIYKFPAPIARTFHYRLDIK